MENSARIFVTSLDVKEKNGARCKKISSPPTRSQGQR
jgi:hypothetical protein